ncbi:MAG TPA: hypothetical protein VGC79_17525 [Polyangiaceae bacterium]
MPGDEIPWDLPQIADELAGQYESLGVIATGGMGVLLRARQKSLRRTVLIKFTSLALQEQAAAQRFLREARAAGRISEPHVVSIYDCGFVFPDSLMPVLLKGPEPDTDHQIPRPGDWVLRFLTGKYAESERGLAPGETLEIGRNSDLGLGAGRGDGLAPPRAPHGRRCGRRTRKPVLDQWDFRQWFPSARQDYAEGKRPRLDRHLDHAANQEVQPTIA